ncbi:MAG: Do family serine endopeptidase [Coxiellaceae bacterium]|nr:Do family serine endopeptidase [Coxiellaceae bacterium]
MKKLLITLLLLPLSALATSMPVNSNGKPLDLAPMLKRITPAVVNIMVEKKPSLMPNDDGTPLDTNKQVPHPSIAVGSGIIISAKNGLIVTNAHVVSHEKLMIVTLKDGRRYHANLIGEDDGFDIAILHIRAKNLKSIPFGDSDKLQVGNFVAAIGSPFGLTQTVTSGVISALNRSEPKIEGYQSFIQTDAPINPGNSGGALVNLKGQLIGMNTAIITPTYGSIGIGFAIPSNMVKSVVTQLIKYGKVERGMLGVIAQNISPALANALHLQADHGVLVTKVVPGSAASTAGVKVKDVILEVNTKKIRNSVQLRNMLGIMRPGTPLKILISRKHKTEVLTTTVGDPKKMAKQKETPFLAGMRLQDFDEVEADGSEVKGALITGVSPDSQGMLAGLMPGDVITTANGKPVNSAKDLEADAQQQPKQLLLSVTRGNSNLFAVIEPR